jgi:isopentenyl-diphosphate delta-isomerase
LAEQGVRIIDCAGLGGTSWARIEAARAEDREIGELFANWGVPSPESIRQVASIPGVTVIGSGGVRSGLDVAKAIAMGAQIVGLAQPFLVPAMQSHGAVEEKIEAVIRQLRISMFCTGVGDLAQLAEAELLRISEHGVTFDR